MLRPRKRLEDVLSGLPSGLLIGDWQEAAGRPTFPVTNPATGEILTELVDATPADAVAALDVADKTLEGWAQTSPAYRSELLGNAYQLVMDRIDDFAVLITAEMGKSLSEAKAEVEFGAGYLQWYAQECLRVSGRLTLSPDGRSEISTRYAPVGPTLVVTPWNFPLAMGARKIAPAIGAGCTVIAKPAALTPLTTVYLAQTLLDAGVPQGVVNVVTTTSASAVTSVIMGDSRLRKVSFTGSTEVGRSLFAASAQNFLRMSLELGGNAPLIVFADADIRRAAIATADAKLRNSGQTCIAPNRIFVQDEIADEFISHLLDRLGTFRLGDGLADDDSVTHGPLISTRARTDCEGLVDEATARGVDKVFESETPDLPGSFMPITVLDGVTCEDRMFHQEIFGPVAPISRFTTEDEAVALANDTPYGLASYVFSDDTHRIGRVSKSLSAGMVGINQAVVTNVAAPFGGIRHSGVGREGGPEGILEYLDLKYVATNLG